MSLCWPLSHHIPRLPQSHKDLQDQLRGLYNHSYPKLNLIIY